MSWNVGSQQGVNAFEFWLNFLLAAHDRMDCSKDTEATLGAVLTPARFQRFVTRLQAALRAPGKEVLCGSASVEEVEAAVRRGYHDLQPQRVVSDILKNPALGKKRLISGPDRCLPHRPAVTAIGQSSQDASAFRSPAAWLDAWLDHVFGVRDTLGVPVRAAKWKNVKPLSRDQYPHLSPEEAAASIPLQLLHLLVFDAIILHAVHFCPEPLEWRKLRQNNRHATAFRPAAAVSNILAQDTDVVCIQEAGGPMGDHIAHEVDVHYWVVTDKRHAPGQMILLRKTLFPEPPMDPNRRPVGPNGIYAHVPGLLAVPVKLPHAGFGAQPTHFWVGSFHGDSDGLATDAAMDLLHKLAGDAPVVAGVDANCKRAPFTGAPASMYTVDDFQETLKDLGLRTVSGCRDTTFKGRTMLQPQLHKAVPVKTNGRGELDLDLDNFDVNPKDHVVCSAAHFCAKPGNVWTVATGGLSLRGMIPTTTFPFDHAMVCATLDIAPHAEASGSAGAGGGADAAFARPPPLLSVSSNTGIGQLHRRSHATERLTVNTAAAEAADDAPICPPAPRNIDGCNPSIFSGDGDF
jgi:hypothetical protein